MAISQIVQNSIANTVSLAVKVSSVQVANSTYVVKDDTAVNTGGGYIVVTGSGFQSGAQVLIGNVTACSTTFVSSTQLRAQVPAQTTGSYVLYVANSDGGIGAKVNGITYSANPVWQTASALTNVVSNVVFSGTLTANDAVSYNLTTGSTLPTGMSLVSANGYYSGNISIGADTTYNFSVDAIDAENQESTRAFSLFVRRSLDGSSSGAAAESAIAIYNLGITTNGYYWLNLDGTPRQFYCDLQNGGYILFAHWSVSTTNGGGASPGSTSYASAVGGYSGVTASAVGAPTTGEDVYDQYGSLSSNYSGQTGSWAWDAYTRGTNTGGSWFRNSSSADYGKMACYRPKIYGYSWTAGKLGMRLSAIGGQNSAQYSLEINPNYNSLDGFQDQSRTINQAYVDGISLCTGRSDARTHQYTWAYDGAATGGNFGSGYGGGITGFISGNYTRLYTSSGSTSSAYDDVTRSFSQSSSNIPPEIRNISDQQSGNEDVNIRAFYIFLK